MDELKIIVNLKSKQLYHFNLYHCYHTFNGIFAIVLALVCIAYALVFRTQIESSRFALLMVLGVLFLVYNPFSLYLRSKSRFFSNQVLQKPMEYHFTKTGIMLSQDERQEEMKWENIYKIVETKESLFIYLTSRHANVLPKEDIGDKYPQVCESIKKYAVNSKVKIAG